MYWMHYYSDPDQHIPGRDIAILWLISAPGSIPLYSYCLYYILDWFYIPFNTSWPWIVHFYGAFSGTLSLLAGNQILYTA